MVEITIIIALIALFFSGIWAAIKVVDDQTDNKWVFFVPAAFLTYFLFSTNFDGGFFFYACLFTFGPIIVMLVKVGLEQGKVPKKRSFSSFDRTARRNPQPLNLNRELAPSYIRAYDRLIAYIEARGGGIKSLEDARQRLAEIWSVPESDVGRFLDSPYVIKTLGLSEAGEPSKEGEIVGDDWWEKGYDSGEQLSSAETERKVENVKKIEDKISSISEPNGDSCGHPGCSAGVTAFDFRCYTCRKRFCTQHAGSSIDCDGCAN
ncbi:MAG: hypothetical protein VX723_03180 [Candidatus Thermoplasmatota archaeon]|nr:hypothetical protein [Candidatus Thermoplasmatota archaeon]